jgi:hypothetical protein
MIALRTPAEQPSRQAGHDHQARTVSQAVRVRWVWARRALPAGSDPDGHVF